MLHEWGDTFRLQEKGTRYGSMRVGSGGRFRAPQGIVTVLYPLGV